jgi:hypothetical protein
MTTPTPLPPASEPPCTDDCCVPDTVPAVSRTELYARAEAAPSSFLAFLLRVAPEAGAR